MNKKRKELQSVMHGFFTKKVVMAMGELRAQSAASFFSKKEELILANCLVFASNSLIDPFNSLFSF